MEFLRNPFTGFRARSLAELLLLIAALAWLYYLYQPLHQAAWQGNQRFAEEQARLELFDPPITLAKGQLLPALCDSAGLHLVEAARRRFCGDDQSLGQVTLPLQLETADSDSFAALTNRQKTVQAYLKDRLANLKKQRRDPVLRAEKPEDSTPLERKAEQTLDDVHKRFNLDNDDKPWADLRCAYSQWTAAYDRLAVSHEAERAETVFTLAALLDGLDIKTIPPAVFRTKAEGCAQRVEAEDIERITRGLKDIYSSQAGGLAKAKSMRVLAQWAVWRFALMAVLAWMLLLLGRVSEAPFRVLALALPLWAGMGWYLDIVSVYWLAVAGLASIVCLCVPLAQQSAVAGGRKSPASVWAYPLAVLLMGLGFWLLIDQSLFFLEKKRFLAYYQQRDILAAFVLISCLPLVAPWLLGWVMGFNHWLFGAQNANVRWLAVLLRYGSAAALVLGVVAMAGKNVALTSDWLKAWLILTSAGVFLTRGEASTNLLRGLSRRHWWQGLARLMSVLLPLLIVSFIAVVGLLKTKDIGPLVVIVLAGAVLVGAIVLAALYAAGNGLRLALSLLAGWAAAVAWIGLTVGAIFIVGRFASRWLPHIRDRLDAVTDPYSSHNDQMALVGMFREKVPDGGFGFAQTPWCGYGDPIACRGLPEQLASDYTVTALIGALGQTQTLCLLLVFCLSLVALVRAHALAAQPSIHAADRWRGYVGWLALLWVLITLAQVAMTLFGNLDRLPLSGITLPFVSYGTVSLLSCAFFLGLVLNVRRVPAIVTAPSPIGRFSLRSATFAILLPIALATQATLYWTGWRAAQDNAKPRHHDKHLYAAAKTLEKSIVNPKPKPLATLPIDWQGPCKTAFTPPTLARLARIIQYRLDALAAPDSLLLRGSYAFDPQIWAKQVERGVEAKNFDCRDAQNALDRLADGQTLSLLDWKERSLKPERMSEWVAVPEYLFDRRDPWIAANGCVFWGGGDLGETVYLPNLRTRKGGEDRCAQVARQASASTAPQPAVFDHGQFPDIPDAPAWSAPPSLDELLAPLAPLRDPGDSKFDRLVGQNRNSDKEPQQGLDVRLTIDPKIQRIAQQVVSCSVGKTSAKVCPAIQLDGYGKAFKENARARMVGLALIHIETGDILALASDHTECYGADFGFQARPKECPPAPYRAAFRPDELLNHAIFTDRMPASTVKPIMALGFLADGMTDVEDLKTELAQSNSFKFLNRLFYLDPKSTHLKPSSQREERVRAAAATVGWNTGCDPGGTDCGRFDPLFGRPMSRHYDGGPDLIGLKLLYGRFFVEPEADDAPGMRLMQNLSFDAADMKQCAANRYDDCRWKVTRLVSTGYGQLNSRTTALGVAGMMARLALAERDASKPTPWPHLLKNHALHRIDGTEYLTAASTLDYAQDGRKLNADQQQDLNQAHVGTILDGLRLGHRIGTSEQAFNTVFTEGSSDKEKQQNLERWRRLLIAGKTGTPSYPLDPINLNQLRLDCANDRKLDCQSHPLKWYGGLFGPAGGRFEYAIAVLSERNWKKDGNIDDPKEAGSNVSAEIAFQLVKRLMTMPEAAPPPVAKPAPLSPAAKATKTKPSHVKPTTAGKPKPGKPGTKPTPKSAKKAKP